MSIESQQQHEQEVERGLPIGWLKDRVNLPEDWVVDFVERGACLRFRNKVDRDEYGLHPPGWPGVGITSGRDYLTITADSDRVLHEYDLWYDPSDSAADVVDDVESAIEAVQRDLERCRLDNILDGCVPDSVMDNLIGRFGTAEKVIEATADTPRLRSVSGVGEAYQQRIQEKAMLWEMSNVDEEAEVVTHE